MAKGEDCLPVPVWVDKHGRPISMERYLAEPCWSGPSLWALFNNRPEIVKRRPEPRKGSAMVGTLAHALILRDSAAFEGGNRLVVAPRWVASEGSGKRRRDYLLWAPVQRRLNGKECLWEITGDRKFEERNPSLRERGLDWRPLNRRSRKAWGFLARAFQGEIATWTEARKAWKIQSDLVLQATDPSHRGTGATAAAKILWAEPGWSERSFRSVVSPGNVKVRIRPDYLHWDAPRSTLVHVSLKTTWLEDRPIMWFQKSPGEGFYERLGYAFKDALAMRTLGSLVDTDVDVESWAVVAFANDNKPTSFRVFKLWPGTGYDSEVRAAIMDRAFNDLFDALNMASVTPIEEIRG